MLSEKQKQTRERRFKVGLNNPKKDAWARRAKPFKKSVDEKFKELSSEMSTGIGGSDLKILRPSIWKRIIYWIKSWW